MAAERQHSYRTRDCVGFLHGANGERKKQLAFVRLRNCGSSNFYLAEHQDRLFRACMEVLLIASIERKLTEELLVSFHKLSSRELLCAV